MITVGQVKDWLNDLPQDMAIIAADYKENEVRNICLQVQWEDESGLVISTIGLE